MQHKLMWKFYPILNSYESYLEKNQSTHQSSTTYLYDGVCALERGSLEAVIERPITGDNDKKETQK